MRSMKCGFVLYTLCVASIALCFVTRVLVRNGYALNTLTQGYCQNYSQQTQLWLVIHFQKRLIMEHYDFLKRVIQKHSQPCRIQTIFNSTADCFWDDNMQYMCIETRMDVSLYRWILKQEKGGEYVFMGYTFSCC